VIPLFRRLDRIFKLPLLYGSSLELEVSQFEWRYLKYRHDVDISSGFQEEPDYRLYLGILEGIVIFRGV
jgi:hypothetical protein